MCSANGCGAAGYSAPSNGLFNVIPKAEGYEYALLKLLGRLMLQIEPLWILLQNHAQTSSKLEHI